MCVMETVAFNYTHVPQQLCVLFSFFVELLAMPSNIYPLFLPPFIAQLKRVEIISQLVSDYVSTFIF